MSVPALGASLDEIARKAHDRALLRASFLVDREMVIRWVSPNAEALLGHRPDQMVGTSALEHVHPIDVETVAEILAFELEVDPSIRAGLTRRATRDIRVRAVDGSWITLEGSATNLYDDPEIGMLLVDVQAPTQSQFLDRAIELSQIGAGLSDILDLVLARLTTSEPGHVAAVIIDGDGRVLAASRNAPEPYGSTRPHEYGCRWEIDIVDAGCNAPRGALRVWGPLSAPHPHDREMSARVASHAAMVISHHRALHELREAADVDWLTGIANRRAFERDLDARRENDEQVVLAYIDLDGFKDVNDRLGHHTGDQVLSIVAARLRGALRPGDIVARLGGDEFVLVLSPPAPPADALRARLAALIAAPIEIGEGIITVSGSVGFASGLPDTDALLRGADREMMGMKRGNRRAAAEPSDRAEREISFTTH